MIVLACCDTSRCSKCRMGCRSFSTAFLFWLKFFFLFFPRNREKNPDIFTHSQIFLVFSSSQGKNKKRWFWSKLSFFQFVLVLVFKMKMKPPDEKIEQGFSHATNVISAQWLHLLAREWYTVTASHFDKKNSKIANQKSGSNRAFSSFFFVAQELQHCSLFLDSRVF